MTFAIKVHPRAEKNAITGLLGEALKVCLTAPPIDGKANAACIELFAKLLKLPRSSVTISSGDSSRSKVIRVTGISEKAFRDTLAAQAESSSRITDLMGRLKNVRSSGPYTRDEMNER